MLPRGSYDFGGFLSPIDPSGVNVTKAGQAIPIKFSLNGDQGLNILADGSPSSRMVVCITTDEEGQVDESISNSGLSYDAETDTYTYVWKTQEGWKNSCRELVLELSDGSVYTAQFQFK